MDGDVTLHKVGLVGGKVAALKVTGKDGVRNVSPLVFAIVGRVARLVATVGEGTLERLLLGVYSHVRAQRLPVLGGELAVRPVTLVRSDGVHVDVEPIRCRYRRQHGGGDIGLLGG